MPSAQWVVSPDLTQVQAKLHLVNETIEIECSLPGFMYQKVATIAVQMFVLLGQRVQSLELQHSCQARSLGFRDSTCIGCPSYICFA